jgi:hypothetical protein
MDMLNMDGSKERYFDIAFIFCRSKRRLEKKGPDCYNRCCTIRRVVHPLLESRVDQTASHYPVGGHTAWAAGLTASSCIVHDLTA